MAAFDSAINNVSCTSNIIWTFTTSQLSTPISMVHIYCLYCRYNCHRNRREDTFLLWLRQLQRWWKIMNNSVDYLLVGHALVVFHSLRYTSEFNSERQLQMAPSTGVHFWHPLCNLTGLLRVAFQSQVFQAIDSHLANNVSYTNLRSNTKNIQIL